MRCEEEGKASLSVSLAGTLRRRQPKAKPPSRVRAALTAARLYSLPLRAVGSGRTWTWEDGDQPEPDTMNANRGASTELVACNARRRAQTVRVKAAEHSTGASAWLSVTDRGVSAADRVEQGHRGCV